MTCETIQSGDLIERYIMQTLSEAERKAFEEHITECPACASLLDQEQELLDGIDYHARKAMKQEIRSQVEKLRKQEPTDWTLFFKVAAVLFFVAIIPGLLYYQYRIVPVTETPFQQPALQQEPRPMSPKKTEKEEPPVSKHLPDDGLQSVMPEEVTETALDEVEQKAVPAPPADQAPVMKSGEHPGRGTSETRKAVDDNRERSVLPHQGTGILGNVTSGLSKEGPAKRIHRTVNNTNWKIVFLPSDTQLSDTLLLQTDRLQAETVAIIWLVPEQVFRSNLEEMVLRQETDSSLVAVFADSMQYRIYMGKQAKAVRIHPRE